MSHYEQLKSLSVIALGTLILFFITKKFIILCLTLFILLLSLFPNPVSNKISIALNKFTYLAGLINSKIILTILFFLVLTPVALLYRLFSNSKVDYFKSNNRKSFFKKPEKEYNKEFFEDPW